MEAAGSLGGKPVVGSSIGDGGVVLVDANAVICSGIQLDFDLNVGGGVDLDNEGGRGGGLAGLHGVDLNEGVNYILHEGLDLNEGAVEGRSGVKKKLIDLNQEAMEEEVESLKRIKWFDLNVELKEDDREEEREKQLPVEGDKGNAILEETPPQVAEPVHALQMWGGGLQMATPRLNLGGTLQSPSRRANAVVGGGARRRRGRNNGESSAIATPETELRQHLLMARMAPFSAQDYGVYAAGVYNQLPFPVVSAVPDINVAVLPPMVVEPPPKVELPPSSASLDFGGAPFLDFLSVYAFLRSFSTLLFLSPFEVDEFAASLMCNDSTSLFDSIHLSLLRAIRRYLRCLSGEGSVIASACLRSLNWDLLDSITWPVFLVEYLLLHKPKHIPGLNLSEFEPFQSDYYSMPSSAKISILQQLCDDLNETEGYRSELSKRALLAESDNWKMKYFASKRKKKAGKDAATTSGMAEEDDDVPSDDGNGDECYLCKMDGDMICCDACPAAIHSRCVGVVSSLLPEGDWHCPECTLDKGKPYNLAKSIRGTELLGTDPRGRLYYSICDYLVVSDSCDDEFLFLLYKGDDLPTVVAALESASVLHEKIICAICKHWNLPHGVNRMTNEVNYLPFAAQLAFPHPSRLLAARQLAPLQALNPEAAFAERRSDEKSAATAYSSTLEVGTSGHVAVPLEAAKDAVTTENQLVSSEGSTEGCQASGDSQRPDAPVIPGDGSAAAVAPITAEGGNNPISANDGGATSASQEPLGTRYVNLYEFAFMASSFSKELTSHKSADDARTAEQIMVRQVKIIRDKHAVFSWSNIYNLNLYMNSKKEKCGWCFTCKNAEDERDCLFVMNDSIRAIESFTSEALGIQARNGKKKHLIDVICHVMWIESRLQGLLQDPWSNPRHSDRWRRNAMEAAHVASLKKLLFQLESSLDRRALSADWTKHVDTAVTKGSASHFVRKSMRVPLVIGSSKSKRKCSKQAVTRTPEATGGLSLSWWRGGRASRELFNWKVIPHSLASNAARQGGSSKIAGVHYSDSVEYAKRMKYTAWRAAVERSRSVEQLALQVRELDANIRWNDIENINVVPKREKESKKCIKAFKNASVRRKRCEGEVVKYLIHFRKCRSLPDIVVKHGSLHPDSSSKRKKYWLEESHVPLHLLKEYEEKQIVRAANRHTAGEPHESAQATTDEPSKKNGFDYLFERA